MTTVVAEASLIGTVVAEAFLIGTVTSSNTQLEAEPTEVTLGTSIAVPSVTFDAVVVEFVPLLTPYTEVEPLTPVTEVVED